MSKTSRQLCIFLGLATFAIFALKLGYLSLLFEEPRRALVSLEMILSGNYVVPKINGFEYYNKPPFYNWILVVFFKLFGYHEWVVRLPTYVSLFAISGMNYSYFKSRIGDEVALLSSFFFLLSGHVLFYFSFVGEIDITYSLIVYGQALVFMHFHEKEKLWAMFCWSYALMTLGFMTKGIPSIAFQGLIIIGFAGYFRRWAYLVHPANFLFLLFSLLCIYEYFQFYSQHSDPWPYLAQLFNESSKRTSLDILSIMATPFKVFGEFLKITFPWCLLAIPLLLRRNRLAKSNKWIVFGLLFVLANSWLYFLSPGTRDRYLYMFLPFIYNALAYYFVPHLGAWSQHLKKGVTIFSILLASFFFYLAINLDTELLWTILSLIGFGLFAILLIKNKISTMMALFGLMLIARLAYDVIVFPSRKVTQKDRSAKTIVPELLELIGDQQLYFYTKYSSTKNTLPLIGTTEVARIERLPYDLGFYVSSETGAVITATNLLEKGKWYVALKDKIEDQEIALQFSLEKKDWVVFKK